MRHRGRLVDIGVGIGMGLLEKIFLDQVWQIWMADSLTKAMQAVWVFRSYHLAVRRSTSKCSSPRHTMGLGEEDFVVDRLLMCSSRLIVVII